jgi:hypothetical protein
MPKEAYQEMIEDDDIQIIDETLAELPKLLTCEGMTFWQQKGYKAGKLKPKGRFSNWCQLIDGNLLLNIRFPNSEGQMKAWKLFARFNADKPPPQYWDRPARYKRTNAQWMLGGDNVWGIAYEDIKELAKENTSEQLLQSLSADLKISFLYSQQKYAK